MSPPIGHSMRSDALPCLPSVSRRSACHRLAGCLAVGHSVEPCCCPTGPVGPAVLPDLVDPVVLVLLTLLLPLLLTLLLTLLSLALLLPCCCWPLRRRCVSHPNAGATNRDCRRVAACDRDSPRHSNHSRRARSVQPPANVRNIVQTSLDRAFIRSTAPCALLLPLLHRYSAPACLRECDRQRDRGQANRLPLSTVAPYAAVPDCPLAHRARRLFDVLLQDC